MKQQAKLNQADAPLKTAYDFCSYCFGSCLEQTMGGIDDCHHCHGDGLERARDSKGRFTVIDVVATNPDPNSRPSDAPSSNQKGSQQ